MKQKIITLIAAAGAMLGATTAFADEEKVGDYTWTYQIENGEAKIYNGESRATDLDPVGDIQIPAKLGGCPVTVIGGGALASCDSMTSVTMPKSVRVIEGYAFIAGYAITNVTFSAMTTSIGTFAFNQCSSLKTLALPDNVVDIASHVFYGCTGITNLTVGAGTKSIGVYAFYGCSSLAKASLPKTLEAVVNADETIFKNCPDSLKIEYYDVVSVTLDANGGEGGGDVTMRKGGTIAGRILPTATRQGYAFAGWWTKKSGGTQVTTKTKVTKDVTYYAHWTVKKFKVAAAVNTKAGGTVSGAGTKKYGSKVTLKATQKKGYVFVKWVNLNDAETPWPSAVKCRQPSVSFTMGAANMSVKAVFAKASSDVTPVLTVAPTEMWYVESDPDREISVAADSLSYPSVTLSGASAGIGLVRVPDTDDRYVLKVTDAVKVKPGVYTAKVTAKNRAGKSVAKSVKIVTPNSNGAVNAGLLAGIEPSTLNPYVLGGGMKMKETLADLGVEVFQTNGWKLASVTGLPTGLSWNGTAIVGAASKTGVFTVTFTMKKTVKDAKTKKTETYTSTASATFKVDALLPATLAGTYNGFANTIISDPGDEGDNGDVGDGGDGEVENVVYTPIMDGWASAAKVTVTAAGKITANIGGAALTGNGFDSESNGVYAVTLRKTQKITKGSLKGKSKVWEAYIEIDTNAAWDRQQLVGWCQTYTTGIPSMAAPAWIVAQRNAFGASADAKAIAAAVAGTRKFTSKSAKGKDWSYDLVAGGKALTVAVKSNGVATLAGKIGSTKVSGTATLEVSGAETVEIVPDDQQSGGRSNRASLMCSDVCDDPVLLTRRTATVRFFSGKFIVEVFYTLEDGAVVSASGRVWRR